MKDDRTNMEAQAHQHAAEPGHEPEGTRANIVVIVGVSLFIVVGLSALVVSGLINLFSSRDDARSYEITTPPKHLGMEGPGQKEIPDAQITMMREAAAERLTSYGWVDRNAGVVHIPIDRAKELYLNGATAVGSETGGHHGGPAEEGAGGHGAESGGGEGRERDVGNGVGAESDGRNDP